MLRPDPPLAPRAPVHRSVLALLPNPVPPRGQRLVPNSLASRFPGAPVQVFPSVLAVPDDRHGQAHRSAKAATPLSWWASPFAATAAQQVVDALEHRLAPVLPRGRACPAACASQWLPASSCNCRSPWDAPQLLPPAGRMPPPSQERAPEQQRHRWPDPHRRRHHDALGTVPVHQEVNAAQVVLTGMTAPSWKPCAAARPRSSARRFTSSARTMIPSQRKPVGSLASRRTWCCRRAWLVLPSPSHSKERHRNRWRRCASVARKRHVSVNAAGPWNCGQHAKPNRCGRK